MAFDLFSQPLALLVIFATICFLLMLIDIWYEKYSQISFILRNKCDIDNGDNEIISCLISDAPINIKEKVMLLLNEEWPGSGNKYLQEKYDNDSIVLILSQKDISNNNKIMFIIKQLFFYYDYNVIGHIRIEPATSNIILAHKSMISKPYNDDEAKNKNINSINKGKIVHRNNNITLIDKNKNSSIKSNLARSKSFKNNTDEIMTIQGLIVQTHHRRSGYGRKLMKSIENYVMLNNKYCKYIYLSTNGRRNISFYHNCGYIELSIEMSPLLPRSFQTNIITAEQLIKDNDDINTKSQTNSKTKKSNEDDHSESDIVWFYKIL